MAEIVIDLSGSKGLGEGFFGDADRITPLPNLNIRTKEGELAGGLFNPYLRKGYIAPTATTKVAFTTSHDITNRLSSYVYNHVNGKSFFSDFDGTVFSSDDLNDTSLTRVSRVALHSTTKKMYDLESYEVNGERKLFGVYSKLAGLDGYSDGYEAVITMNPYPSPAYGVSVKYMFPAAGSTTPEITDYDLDSADNSGTSTSETLNVTGTDTLIVAVVMSPNPLGTTSATCAGNAMTSSAGSSGTRGYWQSFYYKNPAVGGNLVVVNTSAINDKTVHYMSLKDVHQTLFTGGANMDGTSAGSTSPSFVLSAINVSDNSLMVQITSAFSPSFTAESGQTLYKSESDVGDAGTTLSTVHTMDMSKPYLQVSQMDEDGIMEIEEYLNGYVYQYRDEAPTGGFIQQLKSDWAFMRNADNGFAYLFADNAIHKLDGTITGGEYGAWTKNVILFPSYFRITDALDYRSRMYVAVHQYPVTVGTTSLNNYTGKCGIFVWNRISTQLSGTDFIELPGVREIKRIYASPDGVLKLLTISDSGLTELRQFGYNDSGGVVFPVVRELGLGAHPQYPDGLSTAGDKVMWLANDGKIYVEKGGAVNQTMEIKTPGTTSDGVVNNILSGLLFYGSGDETSDTGFRSNKQGVVISYNDTTPQVYKVYPFDMKMGDNSTQTTHQGDVYSGVNYIPVTSIARSLRIYNAPVTGSGTDVIATVKIYFNQSTTPTVPSGMTKSITKNEAKRGYVDFHLNMPYIHAIQIEVEWSTSEPLSGDIYLPSVAIVTHEPTTTQSADNG